MELSIKERFTLLGLLPNEGNFLTLRIIRDLQKELSFSEEEHAKFELKATSPETVTWNLLKEKEIGKVKINIGEKAKTIICEQLEKMNQSKTLTIDHIDLYSKFIGE